MVWLLCTLISWVTAQQILPLSLPLYFSTVAYNRIYDTYFLLKILNEGILLHLCTHTLLFKKEFYIIRKFGWLIIEFSLNVPKRIFIFSFLAAFYLTSCSLKNWNHPVPTFHSYPGYTVPLSYCMPSSLDILSSRYPSYETILSPAAAPIRPVPYSYS